MLFQSNTDTHRDVCTLYSLLFIKGILCDPMDYVVHGIFQARILDYIAFPFSGGLANPGIEPRSPAL